MRIDFSEDTPNCSDPGKTGIEDRARPVHPASAGQRGLWPEGFRYPAIADYLNHPPISQAQWRILDRSEERMNDSLRVGARRSLKKIGKDEPI
jgi:hypothetical protein